LGAEDTKAFQKLLLNLHRDRAPQGELEEILVEKIAICIWKERRVVQCETGIIRRAYVPDAVDLGSLTNSQRAQIKDHLRLPSGEDMNRILRYEVPIERKLASAINQLERLQRARKGEHVPVPVTLQISSGQ
jgi:hypothetical protein